jgi:hypothetical protein
VFSTFRAVEKVTGGDFRGLARLMVANKPKESGELCEQLEAAASALRTELASSIVEEKEVEDEIEVEKAAPPDEEGENNL